MKELSQEVASVTTFSCPLLTYLSTSTCPTPAHLQLLCSQHGSGGVTSSGQGPLHLLLNNNNTSVNQQQLHSLLPDLVTSLLQAGVRLDQRDEEGNTALLALTHLLEKREWSLAAHIATLFCTRSDCDVNSGMFSFQRKSRKIQSGSLIFYANILLFGFRQLSYVNLYNSIFATL